MLDPALIAALAAVVREGNFANAARALHVTPSAVSQRVKLLEERVGTVLVVRGQPCRATEVGARLCRHAELVGTLKADLRRELPELAALLPERGPAPLRVAVTADSLGTWFIAAMATFAATDDTLVDITLDDQDHTADRLRGGQVLAAVTSLASPVAGCRSRRLGALRYAATASPAFVRRWFGESGVTAAALARAPSLRYDRKDTLQAQWVRRLLRRDVDLPAHRVPSTPAFVDATLAGLGWGMNPLALVQPHLAAGRLVELAPDRRLDVPLYWQCARLPVPALVRLTDAVIATALHALA